MKLDPPSRRKVRVHELAKELGWTSRPLLDELGRRGEFVKSASSTLEPPVVCETRREFASVDDMLDPDVTVAPEAYGKSAYPRAAEVPDESFGAARRRAKSRSAQRDTKPGVPRWRSTILQFIFDEVIVRRRPEHLHRSQGSYFRWELKQAEEMNAS
ncbi:translation initiation factor IF-2 N-terminal domain-containing protein [Mycolicibacter senuensis]|uniref:translation initiation factor IF-2 N-terminal domain-containing protein n=1 Tax=Mycolicibacter senuensis TaxID=386913 RepID=UPI000DCCA35E|nr:translation initiation factor IF-2 N-terminal domain-containing protein [Mycolicibacter senuensis]RAV00127.1 hypothetical protein DQP56_09895 [Mycolicibacter senuensis]